MPIKKAAVFIHELKKHSKPVSMKQNENECARKFEDAKLLWYSGDANGDFRRETVFLETEVQINFVVFSFDY